MYVPLRLGFFIIARHCASLFFSIAVFLEISLFLALRSTMGKRTP